MFEGTGKYFLIIFLIILVVYMTKKICLYFLFKRSKIAPYKALIPIYATYTLVDMLNMKKSIFYLCLIPVINIFFYYQIHKELLVAFGQDKEEAIWYTLIPMYKFPELVFKKPHFILDEYDLTNEFITSQKALFEKPQEELPYKIDLVNLADKVDEYHAENASRNQINVENTSTVVEPTKYEQMPSTNIWNSSNQNEPISNTQNKEETAQSSSIGASVFTNQSLEPDKRQEKEYVAKKEEKQEANPINPYNDGRPQMCPNCGAKLSPGAQVCFLCGTKLK